MSAVKTLRTCPNGHQFYKSSDCPVCPVCESEKIPAAEFLAAISAPARRALESLNILSLRQLSDYSEKEILALHGMGPKAVRILDEILRSKKLSFRKN